MGDLTKNISRHEVACRCGNKFGTCNAEAMDFETIAIVQDACDHFANNLQDKMFYNAYTSWADEEPFQEDYTKLESNYDKEDTSELVYDQEAFNIAYEVWFNSEPIKPLRKTLSDYPEYPKYLKLRGVEFEGVMCSATKKDYWGLGIAFDSIRSGLSTVWDFDNGNQLLLTPDNIEEFKTVWLPFRLSFFD
ncbi:hypothetical protein VPHK406_0067 [Vibrio phage K406]